MRSTATSAVTSEMTTKWRDRNTKAWLLWVLGGLLVVVIVLAVFMRLSVTHEPVLRAGDEEAALAAELLVPKISNAIASVDPSDRPQAAESWLLEPDDEYRFSNTEWLVEDRDGSRIPVTFYVWWEDRSFSGSFWGNGPYWGRSCQVFTVTAEQVTAETVDCAAYTPDQPAGQSESLA